MSTFPLLKYLVVFLIGYVVTRSTVPVVARIATSLGAIDHPGPRRVHSDPIPRGGGVAVFLGFYLAAASVFFVLPDIRITLLDRRWWQVFSAGAACIVLVGIIDDLLDLKAIYKLAGQITAALILFVGEIRFTGVLGFQFPLLLDVLATVFWFVLIINALNLVDGYDGLATGLASIAALGIGGSFIYRHLPVEALVATALIGACVGFLRYNRHPATIFLGDSGSMFLGFTLAAMTTSTASRGTGLAAIWIPLLALGVPVFDTVLAVWRRAARGILSYLQEERAEGGIMSADMDHVHHRLIRLGLTPKNVTATLYLANSAMVLIGLLGLAFHDFAIAMFSAGFAVGIFLLLRVVARVELWDSGMIVVHSLTRVNRPTVAVTAFLLLDLLAAVAGYLGAEWFMRLPFSSFQGVVPPAVPLAHSAVLGVLLLSLHPYATLICKRDLSQQLPGLLSFIGIGLILYAFMLVHQADGSTSTISWCLTIGLWVLLSGLARLFPHGLARLMSGKLVDDEPEGAIAAQEDRF